MQLTTLERLIITTLSLSPNLTLEQLEVATGVKALKNFSRVLRGLTMAGLVSLDAETATYKAVSK